MINEMYNNGCKMYPQGIIIVNVLNSISLLLTGVLGCHVGETLTTTQHFQMTQRKLRNN